MHQKVFVIYRGNEYWHPFSHVCVLTVVLHHWSAPQHQRSSWHALLWKLEDKTSLVIRNKCLYFIAQLKSNWGLIDGGCQIYPCFLQETFCSRRTLRVKKGGKISAFLISSPYRHWVAVWIIDWLKLGCCLGYWLTDTDRLTDWLTETGLLSWLLTDWLKLGYCLDNLLTDWLTNWLKLGYCLGYWLTD